MSCKDAITERVCDLEIGDRIILPMRNPFGGLYGTTLIMIGASEDLDSVLLMSQYAFNSMQATIIGGSSYFGSGVDDFLEGFFSHGFLEERFRSCLTETHVSVADKNACVVRRKRSVFSVTDREILKTRFLLRKDDLTAMDWCGYGKQSYWIADSNRFGQHLYIGKDGDVRRSDFRSSKDIYVRPVFSVRPDVLVDRPAGNYEYLFSARQNRMNVDSSLFMEAMSIGLGGERM